MAAEKNNRKKQATVEPWSSKDTIPLDEKYKESTLTGWHPAAPNLPATQNASIDLGWGKLLFAHTFHKRETLISMLSDEAPGRRNIAFYLREPHVILADAPQEIFLDPSHSYRLWLEGDTFPFKDEVKTEGFVIRPIETLDECRQMNEIYLKNSMVTAPPEFIFNNKGSKKVQYLAAIDNSDGKLIGTITGLDHTEIFNDSEKGASFWCLAVDPDTPLPGVGRALVGELARIYKKRKLNYLDLSVFHDNAEAISFYETLGFVRVPVFTLKYKNAYNEPLYTSDLSEKLNPYAEIILKEARRRGIKCEIVTARPALFDLTFGGKTVRCHESLSDHTSAVAMSLCQNKHWTSRLLRKNNLRTPDQLLTDSLDEGMRFFEKYKSVVIKPVNGEQGDKVFVDIRKKEVAECAFREVQAGGPVLIEEFFKGDDLRVVVIDNQVVAAARRDPPEIIGTGHHPVEKLIEKYNRRRMAATGGESKIPLDSETLRSIEHGGYETTSVLPEGERLRVRKTANLHTGGVMTDITAELPPEIKEAAILAAKVLGIPVVGFDFILNPESGEFCFIEANERPGLANHEPQPTAEKFIDFLFPQTMEHPNQVW